MLQTIIRIVMTVLKLAVRPLASRKVRVALATFLSAYVGEYGFGLSPELTTTILGVGIAVILGIAVEDNGTKSAGGV